MASVEDEKKGKSGLLSRWFRGGDAATAPVDAPPSPAASEAELRLPVEPPLADSPAASDASPRRPRRSKAGFSACA